MQYYLRRPPAIIYGVNFLFFFSLILRSTLSLSFSSLVLYESDVSYTTRERKSRQRTWFSPWFRKPHGFLAADSFARSCCEGRSTNFKQDESDTAKTMSGIRQRLR